jgi:23S rRNA (cytosine1962-C5)-methyltransferase
MQQASDKFLMFRNRLEKTYKHLSKQARRQGITCFRIYDHDLPEFPFIIEQYGHKLYVAEYQRNHNLTEEAHEDWLQESKKIMSEIIGISTLEIYSKVRRRITDRSVQYQKTGEEHEEYIVQESGLNFLVNLTDYLDTGLFLDHRITRTMVRDMCANKRVLNLFCYTGSFSVYAAAGNASEVISVDLSKTYLNWAERNMQLNFPDYRTHHIVHSDVKVFLKERASGTSDIIIMDPPTFSNSKRMKDTLDIQKDHVYLINECLRILSPNGLLFFSTNYSRFNLQTNEIKGADIKDITKATTPFDFSSKLKRQCFSIKKTA